MPFMQYLERISEIQRRASTINLGLGVIARRAKVPVSTLWRWQTGKVSPTQRTLDKYLSALEAQLESEERKITRAA